MHLSAFAWLHGMDQWMMDHLLETRKERCMCRAAAHRARRVAEPSDVRSFVSNLPLHPSVRPSIFLASLCSPKVCSGLCGSPPSGSARRCRARALYCEVKKKSGSDADALLAY